jgi:ssDNA-binding Zn-finger/Zn-ribbon topoisomerase 1
MRLIDADNLTNEVDTWGCNDYDKYDFIEAIDNAPTVETNKIEHKAYNEGFKDGVEQGIKLSQGQKGEWIDHSEDYGYVECPICEHLTNCDGNKDELHYCWYCGAKMGKVEQNEI